MKTKINEIKIVATSKFRLNNAEMSNLIGGTSSLEDDSSPVDSINPMSGCGCCLCSPKQSARGAGHYTATASGGR